MYLASAAYEVPIASFVANNHLCEMRVPVYQSHCLAVDMIQSLVHG